jgi:hypothetical protein
MIQHPTCFVPKKIYETYGYFDSNYKYSGDYDLIMRLVRSGVTFSFMERVLVNFRLDGSSSGWQADIDMWRVRLKYRLVSRKEGWIRLCLVPIKAILKKYLK